jgi:AraC-like DNA-binding protein
MQLNLLEALIIIGGGIGLALGIILLTVKRYRCLANQWLALFVMLLSINLILNILQFQDHLVNVEKINNLFSTVTLIYGPLLYLYANTLIKDCTNSPNRRYLHFLPALGYLIIVTVTLSMDIDLGNELQSGSNFAIFAISVQIASVLQFMGYLVLTIVSITRYNHWLKDNYSDIDQYRLNWLKLLISFMITTYMIWTIAFSADIKGFSPQYSRTSLELFWLVLSCFIYWVGYYAIVKPNIFTDKTMPETQPRPSDKLDQQSIVKYKIQLIQLLETEKVYLDPNLNLKQLAEKLTLSDKKLSQVLNSGFNLSFYNLINQYRVEEVKRCILLPQHVESKLEVLAYEAGFKSPSTFNRQFKNITSMTPRAFREASLA